MADHWSDTGEEVVTGRRKEDGGQFNSIRAGPKETAERDRRPSGPFGTIAAPCACVAAAASAP